MNQSNSKGRYSAEKYLPLILAALSLLGGIINGILGTGSGVLFMLAATLINKYSQTAADMYSLSMACVIPTSAASILLYPRDVLDIKLTLILFVPALIGGFIGGRLKKRLETKYLSLAFSVLTIYSGIQMILNSI